MKNQPLPRPASPGVPLFRAEAGTGASCARRLAGILAVVSGSLSLAGVAAAQPDGDFEPQWKPHLDVTKRSGSIRIDGDLGDAGWRTAARASGFAEVNPGDQVQPDVESEAWITYDAQTLYVALIAYDDPSEVRASFRERDAIFRDDYFGVMLDTYGDFSWGYELFVNPLGIQGDLRMLSDGNEDMTFDIVFDSVGKVTETGYQVELAIPFASLRFPERAEHVWNLNFWRDRQREIRRRYAWAAIDRDDSCFMCNFGTLHGIEGIAPASNMDVIVSALGTQAGALEDRDDPTSRFDNQNADFDASLSLRYGVTSSSSAELTLNPDFSQIESDAGQIDVNTTFALSFPERRPFFQEGSDLYQTWISTIYTRSINNPDVAGKVTGQTGSTSYLYFVARDDNAGLIVPGEEGSDFYEADNAVSNIARVRQAYGTGSFVGALGTDRRMTGDLEGSGSVVSVDGRHRFDDKWQIEYQLAGSHVDEPDLHEAETDPTFVATPIDRDGHTRELDGESFTGHALYTSLERNGRTWSHDIDYWEYSPRFRTDNGFTTRVNYRVVSINEQLWFRPNGRILQGWGPWMNVGREWNYNTDLFEDEWFRIGASANLTGQSNLWSNVLWSNERFGGRVHEGIRAVLVGAETQPSETFSIGSEHRFGRLIGRTDDPFLGDSYTASVWGTWKPSSRLVIAPSWNYGELGFASREGKLFAGYILRTRATYQFSRELSARFVTQYNSFAERLDLEPLVTYRVNPFTVFFVGATSNHRHYTEDAFDAVDRSEWEMTDRQFFAKVQYLFRR